MEILPKATYASFVKEAMDKYGNETKDAYERYECSITRAKRKYERETKEQWKVFEAACEKAWQVCLEMRLDSFNKDGF